MTCIPFPAPQAPTPFHQKRKETTEAHKTHTRHRIPHLFFGHRFSDVVQDSGDRLPWKAHRQGDRLFGHDLLLGTSCWEKQRAFPAEGTGCDSVGMDMNHMNGSIASRLEAIKRRKDQFSHLFIREIGASKGFWSLIGHINVTQHICGNISIENPPTNISSTGCLGGLPISKDASLQCQLSVCLPSNGNSIVVLQNEWTNGADFAWPSVIIRIFDVIELRIVQTALGLSALAARRDIS